MTTKRSKELCLALCEAKGSVTTSPQKKILDEVGEFVLDIKSRATMFSRNHYEAFLICSFFKDGGDVESACLYIDLGAYRADKNAYEEALILDSALPTAQPSNDPQAQLQAILRAQANTVRSQDKYLAGMLSEEATRTAAIAMFRDKGAPPNSLAELDAYILERARQIGVEREWAEGQKIIGETKETEDQLLQAALRRYRHPEIEME